MLRTLYLSLLAGTALGRALPSDDDASPSAIWQPVAGIKWQIMIWNNLSVSADQPIQPPDTPVFDVDLFNTPKEVFDGLHAAGKKAICYFSAGSGENWRPDYGNFSSSDLGSDLSCWPGEKYVNIKSASVWSVMANRIKLAAEKGCDGIDPDNMDAYQNGGGGFGLTQSDSTAYLKKMAAEAKKYNVAIGLKNALEVLPAVLNDIQFAVNEECHVGGDCGSYDRLLSLNKPVFNIEYTNSRSASTLADEPGDAVAQAACSSGKLSTVIKHLNLDGWAQYCDGSTATTKTFQTGTGGPSDLPC